MDQAPGAMSVFLDVVVMSGRRAQISADLGTSIHEIQQRARRILEIGHGVLLNAKGERLASMATVRQAGLENGDVLTLQIRPPCIASSSEAIAVIRGDGTVTSWGDPDHGGDCQAVP